MELRLKQQKKILVLFFILYSLFFIPSVFAEEDTIGQSQITPASPLYFLKSIRENLELRFAGTKRVRSIRELEFATRRIREVKSLVSTNRQDLIEPTLYQYLFHLEKFIGVADLENQDFASSAIKNITEQMNILQAIYIRVSDKRALMSIRATINSLAKLDLKLIDSLNLAKKPLLAREISLSRLSACSFLGKEASSSALNEVEKAVFAKRANECLGDGGKTLGVYRRLY